MSTPCVAPCSRVGPRFSSKPRSSVSAVSRVQQRPSRRRRNAACRGRSPFRTRRCGGDDAVGLGRGLASRASRWAATRARCVVEQRRDLVVALGGVQVPGEGDQVAPEARRSRTGRARPPSCRPLRVRDRRRRTSRRPSRRRRTGMILNVHPDDPPVFCWTGCDRGAGRGSSPGAHARARDHPDRSAHVTCLQVDAASRPRGLRRAASLGRARPSSWLKTTVLPSARRDKGRLDQPIFACLQPSMDALVLAGF